ncbi:MAG: cbb3-type cytochrome c oxidase subunit I [Chloroflexi bacterium]|nr:cbb3-type cytochrome c oxidase subunit I [Chloroflexota bacterium]
MAKVSTNVQPMDSTDFRTCPVTGLKVHLPAQRLIIANAVTAVVALLIGGIFAILIAFTRVPAVKLLPPETFYRLLTAHGTDMLVFWIVFFEVAGLYFGGAVLLNARLVKPGLGWLAWVLMLAGAILTNIIMLAGKADVMFTAYPPLQAHPLFYFGVILFAVGALLAIGLFMATVIVAKSERRFTGSVPLVTYGLIVAAIIGIFTLLAGAVAFVPTFLWSVGLLPRMDPGIYRIVFWAFGHPAQQVNLAAMVAVWYALATLTVGAKPVNEKVSRFAFLLYVLFINLGSMHHLLVDPALGTATRMFNTSYFMYLAVVGSLIHAYSIPAAVEVAQRKKGITGLFGWLTRAPWGEPGFAALVISMVIFGFIGGTTGVIQGNDQINLIAHNTLRIPGHFHATVVGGTTLAFMGLTYYLLPLMTQKQLVGRGWARVQPYIFGSGIAILALGMLWSGIQGVPRRTADISASGLAGVDTTLVLVGVGGTIAFAGLVIYILIAVSTLLFGKRQKC